ncbi:MAG: PAS domain-containing sensor histidine kinase [bacterium]
MNDFLDENRLAFESLFTHAQMGIVLSNEAGVIEKVNPYLNRMFGYAEGELIGQKIEVLVPPELRERHLGHREAFHRAPASRPMGSGLDLAAVKKDGTSIPVEISLTFYERGGRREIVSFISDISERKKVETKLRSLNLDLERQIQDRTKELAQAFMELQQTNLNLQEEVEQRKRTEQECQRAYHRERELNELKSRFVSIASHEFRTPLSSILSSASLLAKYQGPGEAERRAKHIDTIKASVRTLQVILDDFLSLDKLEQGGVEPHPVCLSLRNFAVELAGEMQALAKAGQRIRHEHRGPDTPILLDQHLLRSVLVNLLSNALKYSPEGTEVEFLSELRDAQVVLTVNDHGIGIPEPDQRHLFETFFRGHNTAAYQGTGLGLHIVKRCLDMMGGIVEFRSEEGRGSTFRVILPRRGEGSDA